MTAVRRRAVVTGAGGFIGGHLVKALVADGYWVRAVDVRMPEFVPSAADEYLQLDLRKPENTHKAVFGLDGAEVYHLAANMGGIGYIEAHKAVIVHDNVLMHTQMLEAARIVRASRYFFASSACVYPVHLQGEADAAPLRESDAYPADAEDGYGWEKLFGERLCRHYAQDLGLDTRVARFHNVYGPLGAYDGGREKSLAAICRKVAMVSNGGTIEVWGDGQQTRSYCYVDDAIEGVMRLTRSDCRDPLNIGHRYPVSINDLVDMVAGLAGKHVVKRHMKDAPQGVRGRTSDNTRIRMVLDWEPPTDLEDGLRTTYAWIAAEMAERINRRVAARAARRELVDRVTPSSIRADASLR